MLEIWPWKEYEIVDQDIFTRGEYIKIYKKIQSEVDEGIFMDPNSITLYWKIIEEVQQKSQRIHIGIFQSSKSIKIKHKTLNLRNFVFHCEHLQPFESKLTDMLFYLTPR